MKPGSFPESGSVKKEGLFKLKKATASGIAETIREINKG
jgi:hypothetical protein